MHEVLKTRKISQKAAFTKAKEKFADNPEALAAYKRITKARARTLRSSCNASYEDP